MALSEFASKWSTSSLPVVIPNLQKSFIMQWVRENRNGALAPVETRRLAVQLGIQTEKYGVSSSSLLAEFAQPFFSTASDSSQNKLTQVHFQCLEVALIRGNKKDSVSEIRWTEREIAYSAR